MQAIKYAAMVSRFTEMTLVEHYQRFSSARGNETDSDTARLTSWPMSARDAAP